MTAIGAILPLQTSGWGNATCKPKIKFNPSTKTLRGRASRLTFSAGKDDIDLLPIMQTEAYHTCRIGICQATAINTLQMLPQLTDYIDIEELHDTEEIEDAFYKASRKFSW